jgi:WD40 repeat protein/serine/threonine protein kinase
MAANQKSPDEILHQAIKITEPAEQKNFLDIACKGNEFLRAEVESLLKAYAESGDFLEIPAIDPDMTVLVTPLTEKPGTVIGRYKLLEKIGEGGMAVVYMAEQNEPIRRKVALKIIKLGLDTKEVIARFEVERQALAMMDHPNIAKVLDAGATQTGRPYFVMELVRGIAITEYCDKNRLSTADRLQLFIQVCRAVQHAHQKGIIHRDVKPSNVLVTVRDGSPVPKVIDFGIAKATNQRLTQKTVFTRFAQMIGTPAYMSPEQAEMSELDVDTRTDVYSLGVLLYELLTGSTPFDPDQLCKAGYGEIQRIIRETQPPKPSTRLTTLGQTLTDVAKHRSATPDVLRKAVRGDLDWIVMKSLEKDRTLRYNAALELSADIQRHLNNEPVQAGAPSLSYKTVKFIRRHRVGATVASLVVAALVVGFSVATLGLLEALEQRQIADSERDSAKEALEREATAHRQTERTLYFNSINLAEKYYLEGKVGRARSLLAAGPEELRGWEWYYLWRNLDQARMTLRGHGDMVLSVAFSPDGKRIASGSRDNTVKIWDTEKGGEPLRTLVGHNGGVPSVAFSPDGKRIVSGSWDETLKIWDVETGREVRTLRGHKAEVTSVAFSPDGKRIVSGSAQRDRTVKIWDAETGNEVMTLSGHRGAVHSVAYSPDGRRIASVSVDQRVAVLMDGRRIVSPDDKGTLKVWDAESGIEVITQQQHEGVTSVAFSPDGGRIVSGGGQKDKTIKIWDAASGRTVMNLRGHEGSVQSVAYSPDGTRIVSCSSDNTLRVWDVESGDEMATLHGHEEDVRSVAYSPDGRQIVSCSFDNTLKLWDAENSGQVRTLRGHKAEVTSVAFKPDGRHIVSSGGQGDGTIKVWDAKTGIEVMTLSGHKGPGPVNSVAYSPDGGLIVSCSFDRTIKVWDAESGIEVMTLQGHESTVESAAFSPDGRRIVSCGFDNTVRVWDAESGIEVMALRGQEKYVRSAAYSPDGRRIVSSSDNGIKVWDAESGAEVMTLRGREKFVPSAAYSPDGRRIVSCSGNTLKLWDAESGSELMTLHGHEEYVRSAAYSPDGRRIVSCGRDGTLKVWDAESGIEVMTLRGHAEDFESAAFGPDGRRIVSGTSDGTIKIWGMADSQALSEEGPANDSDVHRTPSETALRIRSSWLQTVKVVGTAKLCPTGTPGYRSIDLSSLYNRPHNSVRVGGGDNASFKTWFSQDEVLTDGVPFRVCQDGNDANDVLVSSNNTENVFEIKGIETAAKSLHFLVWGYMNPEKPAQIQIVFCDGSIQEYEVPLSEWTRDVSNAAFDFENTADFKHAAVEHRTVMLRDPEKIISNIGSTCGIYGLIAITIEVD